ncbi:hypothetical protein PIROE2DRAFT_10343, partial [Piromyces sp. E2]
NHYQEDIVNDFNKYAIEQDLDIEIHRTALSILNTTVFVDDYASFVETVLNKNSNDYDLFLVDIIYTNRFSNYVSDLNEYVSKEIIDKYSSGITSKIGYVGEKLVGLPMFIDVGILLSSRELLDKYDKKPPKTWDEMIEIVSYIKEKEKGNKDIVGYLGGYP